jgi:DNA ligase-1
MMSMSKQFKPMLSATYKKEGDIKFPVLASPKLDGIRCLIVNGVAVSRTLKPIPNQYVQELFGRSELNGLDGELIVGLPTDPNCMQNTSSGVMSRDGQPDVKFYVFDNITSYFLGFIDRFISAGKILLSQPILSNQPILVPHVRINSQEELDVYEAEMLDLGYEGIMIRNPDSPYKYGRSTIKEGGLIKVKRFSDSEGTIIGFEEKYHNQNEKELDNLGNSKRSLKQEGMVGANTLGVLILDDPLWPEPVRVGSGFTDELRNAIWSDQDGYLGKMWKYKYFDHGIKEAPRHSVSLGERFLEDM